MCMQLILGLKPPCSGWISDVWVERRDKISFSNTLLITDRRVIPRKFEGLVKSAFLPLGIGTMRPSWKDVGMWPDSRIELKMTFRMLAVKGCENIRCSLLRLSGPAAFPRGKENITLSISSVLIRSGSTSGANAEFQSDRLDQWQVEWRMHIGFQSTMPSPPRYSDLHT